MSHQSKMPSSSGEGTRPTAEAATLPAIRSSTAVELEINGTTRRVDADPRRSLLWVLRDDLGLTGSKYGCGEGQCGACTVLVDGVPRNSCITPLAAVSGKSVTTIEGLARNGELHPLQRAFLEEDALQCGYCTSGMIMAAAGLLRRSPDPDEAEIVRAMEGNICRCGTYRRIVAAIRRAASGTSDDRAAPRGSESGQSEPRTSENATETGGGGR